MLEQRVETVEFVAGPLDGFRQIERRSTVPRLVMVRSATMNCERSSLQLLLEILMFRYQPRSGLVAIYELRRSSGGLHYRYVRSVLESDKRIQAITDRADERPRWMEINS